MQWDRYGRWIATQKAARNAARRGELGVTLLDPDGRPEVFCKACGNAATEQDVRGLRIIRHERDCLSGERVTMHIV